MKTTIQITALALASAAAFLLTSCASSEQPSPGRSTQTKTYEMNGHTYVQERIVVTDHPFLETKSRTRMIR